MPEPVRFGIVDHGNPGYTGFAVDNIVVNDWLHS